MLARLAKAPALGALAVAITIASPARADEPSPQPAPSVTPPPADPAPAERTAGQLRYTLEGIELRGNSRTSPRVILRYVPFKAGGILEVNDPEIELTRYRLLGTGFFSAVQLSLRKGSKRGSAVLVIELVERNTLVVQNLWLGIAADEDTAGNAKPLSAFMGLQAAETNLLGTGITVGAGLGLAADQFALRAFFEDPAFLGTGWSTQFALQYNDARDFFGNRAVSFESPLLEQREVTDYAVVAYKRLGGTLGAGHDITSAAHFSLDYHLERISATVPNAASHLRGDAREPIDFHIQPGVSALSTLGATLGYDTRDAPFLATRGTLATARITVAIPPLGSSYSFQRVELAAQRYFQLPFGHVIRASAFAGGIAGDAPFFEKFYVGDFTDLLPDRILDLAPDRRQPPNFLGTDIIEVRYGDFAARLEGEYRVRLYDGQRSIYAIDVFGAAGIYAVASRRELTDPPRGYTGWSRVPADLTYNLGFRIDTKLGGFTLAFSNLLGLFPARRGAIR
ncbi:MAG: BamA/TamA family outer membrane protein [Byssovorax sp.]